MVIVSPSYLLTGHIADLQDVDCDPWPGAGCGGEEQSGHTPLPALQAHWRQAGVRSDRRHLQANITTIKTTSLTVFVNNKKI